LVGQQECVGENRNLNVEENRKLITRKYGKRTDKNMHHTFNQTSQIIENVSSRRSKLNSSNKNSSS
jgi:hypothetical protein